ncbi:MAG: LptF/LptG family permease [Pseudomonadota bacterium]
MLTLIDRYILRMIAFITLGATGGLTIMICMLQSLRLIELIISGHLNLQNYLLIIALLVPRFVTITLPLAMFGAIIFIYYKCERTNELAVLRAAGISDMRLARPVLLFAGLITVAVCLLKLFIVPYGQSQSKEIQILARGALSIGALKQGEFNSLSKGLVLYFTDRSDNGVIHDIFIQDNREPDHPRNLIARKGQIFEHDSQSRILLEEGIQQYRVDGIWHSLNFHEYSLVPDERQGRDAVWRKPAVRSTHELMKLPDREELTSKQMHQMHVELHHRFSGALQAASLMLIAITFSLGAPFDRVNGARKWIGIGIGIGLVVVLADFLLVSIARKHVWAIAGLYGLHIVAGGLALFMFLKRRTIMA